MYWYMRTCEGYWVRIDRDNYLILVKRYPNAEFKVIISDRQQLIYG